MPGPRSNFKTFTRNPNPRGGCLCSPSAKVQDCTGPYAVATHAEMYDPRNGSAVIGAGCLLELARKVAPAEFEPPAPPDPDERAVAAEERAAEVERVLAQMRAVLGED